ncbi:MAG: SIS domain-containing protein, partial [bacterium]
MPLLWDDKEILRTGKEVLQVEGKCVLNLSRTLSGSFSEAVKVIARCGGKILVTGMGKSGIIGKKIAATLSSYGITAYFLHPAEALHGDLGMARPEDVLLVLSKSGNTAEVLHLVELLKLLKIPIITLTSSAESRLAQYSDIT